MKSTFNWKAERSVSGDTENRFYVVMAQKVDVDSTFKDVEERLVDEEDEEARSRVW